MYATTLAGFSNPLSCGWPNLIESYREDTSHDPFVLECKYGIDIINGVVQKRQNRARLMRQS